MTPVPVWHHLLALVLLALLSPTTWRAGESLFHFSPDTGAYLSLAREMAADGRLALEGWGQPDNGVILPPLYPAAIALAAPLAGDGRGAAEMVSWVAALLGMIPLYFLGARIAGPAAAVAAVTAAHWNIVLAQIALSPLTESLFICVTAFALLALRRHARGAGGAASGLLAGVLIGTVFLSRQIGLMLLVFAALWLFLPAHPRPARRAGYPSRLGWLLIGFAVVVAPYGTALWQQTGKTPLHQHYHSSQGAPRVDAAVREKAAELQAIEGADYATLYAKRRALRALIPDATAMYAAVDLRERDDSDVLRRALARVADDPARLPRAVLRNARSLAEALGPVASALFVLSLLTLLWAPPGESGGRGERALLALFVLGYLGAVSLATGEVARYVHVLIPFVLVHVACETAVLGRALLPHSLLGHTAVPVLAMLGCMAAAPGRASQLEPRPRFPEARLSTNVLAREVPPGAPVLTLHPMHAYYLGGRFRTLPNDTLPRIVDYARATGVRWLLVARTTADLMEMGTYYETRWYLDPLGAARQIPGVDFCCSSRDGELVLLRIDPLE